MIRIVGITIMSLLSTSEAISGTYEPTSRLNKCAQEASAKKCVVNQNFRKYRIKSIQFNSATNEYTLDVLSKEEGETGWYVKCGRVNTLGSVPFTMLASDQKKIVTEICG